MPSKRLAVSRRALAVLPLLACTAFSAGVAEQAAAAPIPNYSLAVSASPDRSSSKPLSGATYAQGAQIYVFTTPTTSATRVRFYLDDTSMSRAPRSTDSAAPFDFGGTGSDGKALPLGTSSVSVGTHTITAAVDVSSKTK